MIDQKTELLMRKRVASLNYSDYLSAVSESHSVPVMDFEVRYFLRDVPMNGIILDIGGCWAWHWRFVRKIRSDVTILILDFVVENFKHAKKLIEKESQYQVIFLGADANSLPLATGSIDAVWSVQTFQHIPSYEEAVAEACRVLKPRGKFACYYLNRQRFISRVRSWLNKNNSVEGVNPDFWLSFGTVSQVECIRNCFQAMVKIRYSEVLFSPELGVHFAGKEGSVVGWVDSYLSGRAFLFRWLARQISYHTYKPNRD